MICDSFPAARGIEAWELEEVITKSIAKVIKQFEVNAPTEFFFCVSVLLGERGRRGDA